MNGDLRILLVDDNEGCRELYALWLDGNYDVQTAENGLAAIETVTDDIDLVLLDRNMPGPNGVDVAEKLREDGYDGGIIMVSSQPLDFDLSQSPFDNYVQKPAQRDHLEHAVERFVTRQRLQDKLNEYYASTATLATLEAQHSEADERQEYERARRRVEQSRAAVERLLEESVIDWKTAFTVLEETEPPETPEQATETQTLLLNS
ncbi:response regulator [Halobacteriaceae archaeon SHR40]|uniref:response regulator n=1 Tax=Halovenus amylolytica TaxID=2500550 RepID=UPI000FE2A921